jgi:opacity protein-like surface antigen
MRLSTVAAVSTWALLAAAAAHAQSPDRPNRFLNPDQVSAYTTSEGDAPGYGVAVRWPIASRLSVRGEGEYRTGGGEDHVRFLPRSAGFNGNIVLELAAPRLWRVTPFVVGGGGLEHHRAVRWATSLDLIDWEDRDSFVVNAGAGLHVAITDHVGARIEVRYADGWAEGALDSIRVIYGTTVSLGARR